MPASSADRIRELCALVSECNDDLILEQVLPELQHAITDHIQAFRVKSAQDIPRWFRADEAA